MKLILGIESSCDDTSLALFDEESQKIIATKTYTQTLHSEYGGVVPELASRSHLAHISSVFQALCAEVSISASDLAAVVATNRPGLAGSLLVGLCFGKGIAWAQKIPFKAVNHLDGHIFSAFLHADGTVRSDIPFPHLCVTASGGHTALYAVTAFGSATLLGSTRDDAAGEAFDKTAKLIGFSYPGGALIERLAGKAGYRDVYHYPRSKQAKEDLSWSFSGLKTAILYDLIARGYIEAGKPTPLLTEEVQHNVASSLLCAITDIFLKKCNDALTLHPELLGLTFVGGVACNAFIREKLAALCARRTIPFVAAPPRFCTDNGSMIALVGSFLLRTQKASPLRIDIFEE